MKEVFGVLKANGLALAMTACLALASFALLPGAALGFAPCDDWCQEEYPTYTCSNGEEGTYAGCDVEPKPDGLHVICYFEC